MAGYYNSLNYGFAYRVEDGKVLGRIREGLKIAFPTMGGQDFRFFVDPVSPVPKGYEGAMQMGFTGFMSRLGYECNQYDSPEDAWEEMSRTWGGKFIVFSPALRNNKYYVLEDPEVEDSPKIWDENSSFFPIPVFYLDDNPAFSGDFGRFVSLLSDGKPIPGLSKRVWNKNQYTPMIAAVYRDEESGKKHYAFFMPQRSDAFSFVNISEGGAYFASIGGLAYREVAEDESEIWDQVIQCRTSPLFFFTKEALMLVKKESGALPKVMPAAEKKEPLVTEPEVPTETTVPAEDEAEKGGVSSLESREADLNLVASQNEEIVGAVSGNTNTVAKPAEILAAPLGKRESEKEFLDRLSLLAREKTLLYDARDLLNFHIAAKSARLVILAGMSGTGKSALIRLYAEALHLPKERLAMIAVRPSWMDDSDILGYLDMKNMTYRPADTGLSELLIEAEKHPENRYIVCFDEMNLARAEHYFAQFISALEEEDRATIRLYNPALASRIYNSSLYPPEIHIGRNVIFTGTINVDESTYHFSDKILDRANVITLHPGKFGELASVLPQDAALSAEELAFMDDMNAAFIEHGLAGGISFRVVRQIGTYLKNIPEGVDLPRADAFDNQVVQRIFTKLRGSGEQMKELISADEKGNTTGAVINVLDRHRALSDFAGARRLLAKKAKELKLYDYTV